MLRQKMTMALLDIDEYQKAVVRAEERHETIAYTRPSSTGLVITETELNDAEEFEKRITDAIKSVDNAYAQLKQAKTRFLALLPKSIQEEMRSEGKAVYASWTQDMKVYGPYAAYFIGDELRTEFFTDFDQFVARFERMREEEEFQSRLDDLE
jgi:hypothetical protein